VSIAAGIPIAALQGWLGEEIRIVRVMPNTPAMVGAGAAGIALGPTCDGRDADVARAIFEAVGSVELVEEHALDVVTALSGSGPAYFFYMIECLVRAAVEEGMPEEQAIRMASQTMYGAAKLLVESGETPALLRERVTSKGGTTAAALGAFQEHGLAAVVARGVKAAARRSRELAQGQ
jgi:pyrroline-5-carboxylate reductase